MSHDVSEKWRNLYVLSIAVTVLAVYLAALQVGFLAVDDPDAVRSVQSGSFSVRNLFLATGNDYYRPLTILSFLVDYRLFGGTPAGYHLSNILLHLANALLVYYLATILFGENGRKDIYPLLAGLIFAVHPVNTEAVVWISARTDLLCCFFFLLSFFGLLSVRRRYTLTGSALIFVAFLCSLMAKEASLFLVVLAPVWFYLERKSVPLRSVLAACAPLFLATLVYLLMRKGLPIAPDPAATTPMSAGGHSLLFITGAAAAFGFYLRKLVYPFPLSIAITEINTAFCTGIFILGFALSALLWMKEKALRMPIAFLALSLIPPLGAMFLSLPWTPYAERYLYLPSVAFALCVVYLFQAYAGRIPRAVLVVCIVLAAIPTVCRVLMWTRPIPFWQDAVAKSPRFGTVRLVLSASYLQADRYLEAEESLRQALRLGLPKKSARNFSDEIARMLKEKGTAERGLSRKDSDISHGVSGRSSQTPASIP